MDRSHAIAHARSSFMPQMCSKHESVGTSGGSSGQILLRSIRVGEKGPKSRRGGGGELRPEGASQGSGLDEQWCRRNYFSSAVSRSAGWTNCRPNPRCGWLIPDTIRANSPFCLRAHFPDPLRAPRRVGPPRHTQNGWTARRPKHKQGHI